MQEKEKNRAAMKFFLRCTTRHHISHTFTSTQNIDLVVSCGASEIHVFIENPHGIQYTLLGGQCLTFSKHLDHRSINHFIKASNGISNSVKANECTYIMAMEELSVFCHWEKDSTPVECFLDIVPLKKSDAESIYFSTCQVYQKQKSSARQIVGMNYDSTATFSGKKTGVQARLMLHMQYLPTITATSCN